MIKVIYENYKRPNYLLTHSRKRGWVRDSENGVQYIVVNNIETVGADCQGLVNSTDGIDKEDTIYEWDYYCDRWTELDTSNPDYKYLSQYLAK